MIGQVGEDNFGKDEMPDCSPPSVSCQAVFKNNDSTKPNKLETNKNPVISTHQISKLSDKEFN